MLATYAAIDPRVQYLGYTMKVFAKVIEDTIQHDLIIIYCVYSTVLRAILSLSQRSYMMLMPARK